jgi:hypothetical protein
MPKALLQKIVQVVKLIRSKGVGVYFITQSPSDIPGDVLAQLSNRVQHALRAYTPDEMKAVRAAARAFRANPAFKTEEAIMELGVGEALVSFLDEHGIPNLVERASILPPQSLMGAAGEEEVKRIIYADELDEKYREGVDRESAYEILTRAAVELEKQRAEAAIAAAEEAARLKAEAEAEKQRLKEEAAAERERIRAAAAAEKQRLKEEAAAIKAAEKVALAAQKEAEREAAKKKRIAQQAVTTAASSVMGALSTNIINAATGGKTSSAQTIAKRAARNALSSAMRNSTSSIIRGLFGNKK